MNTKHLKDFIRQPFAWPGGYPLFALMGDGGIICRHCAADNARMMIESTRRDYGDGWDCAAVAVNWENTDLVCDNCGQHIEAAYCEVTE